MTYSSLPKTPVERVAQRRPHLHCGVVLLWLSISASLAAQQPPPALKAAFVYNFAKFADWPVEVLPSAGPFVLCVIDQSGMADALAEIVQGQVVAGHPLMVRRVTPSDDLRSCHLLYVSGFDAKTLPRQNDGVAVSAVSGRGLDVLVRRIAHKLWQTDALPDEDAWAAEARSALQPNGVRNRAASW